MGQRPPLPLPPGLAKGLAGSGPTGGPAPGGGPAGVDEGAWLDVIHKMDEVYTQLVADEAALQAKNAELEQTQQFLVGLLSSMSDVLIAIDAQGRIVQTNAALCELAGQPDEALRGTALAALLADDVSGARLRHTLDTVLATRQSACVEVQLRGADGTPVPVDLNCTRRRSAGGKRAGHVLVGRPLGEVQRAYAALREAHAAVQRTQAALLHAEKMAALGRLVAGVAHELNNPISFVLGNVHALQRYGERIARYLGALHEGADAAELQQLRHRLRIDAALADLPSLMQGMHEGAQRTADIVAGLKRFSAVDREERAALDLRDVVERAIHWMRKGSLPDFTVHWTPPAAPVVVEGHAGPLMQVAMNLIQNAADATAGRPGAALHIALQADGHEARLRFADNGPGLAPDVIGRVFDPFFTTKPVGQGTGLGLSISHGIVQHDCGTLTAANAADTGGACFTVTLPLAPPGTRPHPG
jgi:two-component system sensor histidine kinase HupT/HoxJ